MTKQRTMRQLNADATFFKNLRLSERETPEEKTERLKNEKRGLELLDDPNVTSRQSSDRIP
jgi:hypothetical protein